MSYDRAAMQAPTRALGRVFRFHLRAGARVALGVLIAATATVVGLMMFLRIDFLVSLGRLLFGAGSGPVAALLVLSAAVAVAAVAAPRICCGLGGWIRHLPVAGATHRRGATAAIAIAQAPMLTLLALPAVAARSASGAAIAPRLAGLCVVALAAAQLSLPVRRRAAAAVPALAAGLLAGMGGWPALAASLPLLAAADLAAGPLRSPRAVRRQWSLLPGRVLAALGDRVPAMTSRPPAATLAAAPVPVPAPAAGRASAWWVLISWRALGWRAVGAYGLALLPWTGALLFIRNNDLPPLPPLAAARAAILGGGAAIVALLALLAGRLAARRPAWPWARSLPWPARRRVLGDAALLGAACLPMVALAGQVAVAAVPPLAGLLALLSARAAGAMRRPAESRLAAAGEILLEGLPLAGLVALVPWSAVALLAVVPLALRAAAARERRLKVGRWVERHHLAAGDPLSWNGG